MCFLNVKIVTTVTTIGWRGRLARVDRVTKRRVVEQSCELVVNNASPDVLVYDGIHLVNALLIKFYNRPPPFRRHPCDCLQLVSLCVSCGGCIFSLTSRYWRSR